MRSLHGLVVWKLSQSASHLSFWKVVAAEAEMEAGSAADDQLPAASACDAAADTFFSTADQNEQTGLQSSSASVSVC